MAGAELEHSLPFNGLGRALQQVGEREARFAPGLPPDLPPGLPPGRTGVGAMTVAGAELKHPLPFDSLGRALQEVGEREARRPDEVVARVRRLVRVLVNHLSTNNFSPTRPLSPGASTVNELQTGASTVNELARRLGREPVEGAC